MFDKLLKGVVGIVTLPVDVVADVVTMGGALIDRDEPYTASKARKIVKSFSDASDPNQ